MNIIFLEAVQDHGGARKSTLELAKRLKERNTEVLIVDFYGSNKEFIADAQSKNLPLQILDKRDSPFILKDNNTLKYFGNIFKFFLQQRNLKRMFSEICKSFSPDYIIVNNRKALSIIPESTQSKTIFFARGWFINSQIPRIDKLLMRKKVDLYMAVSQSTRQALYCSEIESLENIHVVKNGIEIDDIKKYNIGKKEIFTVIHSGGFLPDKGQRICIEIAKKLKLSNVPFQFVFTGKVYEEQESQDYFKEILQTISREKLEDYIQVIHNTDNVLSLIASSHILVHPSETEGLPRVILEAMALKTFVIANPVGGVTDFILDGFTGFIAAHNDTDDYVEKIIFLKNNPEFLNQNIEQANNLVITAYNSEMQVNDFLKAVKK